MRLILNQIGRRLNESLDPDRRRQKLLLMLDEFAALGRLDFFESQLMVSRQETSRPLLTPGEIMQLSSKEAIVMVSGLHPLRATKVRYYEDPHFRSESSSPLEQEQFSCPRARMRTGRGTQPLRPRSNCLRLGSESVAIRMGGCGASQNCRSTRRSKSRHRSRNMSSMLVPMSPTQMRSRHKR